MLDFNVKADIKEVTRYLDNVQRKQVPFALARALTQTAWDTSKAEAAELDRIFDRPTPFTKRAFTVRKATKTSPTATILLKPKQADYLHYQITGGLRLPERRAIPIPVKARTNRYGNRSRGLIDRLLRREDTFSGQPKGQPEANEGIYQRPRRIKRGKAGQLRLMIGYRKRAAYRPLWQFHKNLARHAARIFPEKFRASLINALRTAK